MSNAPSFVAGVAGFEQKHESEKVLVFGWFLHTARALDRFAPADLNACFDECHLPRPSNIHRVLARMCESRPPSLLRDGRGYRLTSHARSHLERELPARATTVLATELLRSVAARVTEPIKKQFLEETLTCFKHQAYRAAIVMAWNLAYSDVLDRILTGDLARFNAQLPKVLPKAAPIGKRSDFEDHKESKILEVARGAGDLSASSYRVMTEKLNKRNLAAHPSSVVIGPVQAEEVICDLVENILLRPVL